VVPTIGEIRATLLLLLILCVTLVAFPNVEIAKAEPKTIFVPDDFLSVFDAVEAASEGDTIYVKKGTYGGPINQTLVINKTLSLMGENPETTILNLHPELVFMGYDSPMTPVYGYENSIEVQANDVELSGFTFKGEGIFFDKGHNTQINDNVITLHLWLVGSNCNASLNSMISVNVGGKENTVRKNIFTGAISVRFSSLNTICDNLVTNGSSIGLVGSSNNRIFNNTVKNCITGVAIHLESSGNAVYENILLNNEVGFAIHVDGSNNVIYNNYVANNSYGINIGRHSKSGENTTLYHNNFVDNIEQVRIESRAKDYGLIFDNGSEGNFWSNYNGTDSNGDGIGDIPYIIDENNRDNFPFMEPVETGAIPEFPSWIVLPLALVITLFSVVVRKHMHKAKVS
jgi:nitrous oxidase accessory protein